MTNLAKFWIEDSPPDDRGYDVETSATVELRLDASSSLVRTVSYHVRPASPVSNSPRATATAPALTLDNGDVTGSSVAALAPSDVVELSGFPSTSYYAHVWEVLCLVNGGFNDRGAEDSNYRFSRFIALRNNLGLRKIMEAERDEYDPIESWASAVNDLLTAYLSPIVNILGEYMLLPQDWEAPLIGGGAPATGQYFVAYDAEYTDYLVILCSNSAGCITRLAVPPGATMLTVTVRVRPTTAPGVDPKVAFAIASRPIGSAWSAELARGTATMPNDATTITPVEFSVAVADLGGATDNPLAVEVYRVTEGSDEAFTGTTAWYSTKLVWT